MNSSDAGHLKTRSKPILAVLLVLIAAGIVVRCYRIADPMLAWHGWRQYDTAAIARNFYEESMNIFYPRVDWRGNSPGYVEAEFQMYTFSVALLYRFLGEHEIVGRVFNILLYSLSALVLFCLVRRLAGGTVALGAVFFYSFVPLSLFYTRSFQPDTMMSLACVTAVYTFWVWAEEHHSGALVLSALAMAIAALIKPIMLYMGLPLIYLAFRKLRWRLLRTPALWLYAAAVFLPLFFWYFHAFQLWKDYGNTFGVFAGEVKQGAWSLFDDRWLTLGKRFFFWLILSVAPLPATLFLIIGFFRRPPGGNQLLYWWAAGFAVSVLLAPSAYMGHDYYQLPIVFVAATLMGYGLALFWNRSTAARALAATGCAAMLGVSAFQFHKMTTIDPNEASRLELASQIRRLTESGAPLVFARPRFYPFHREFYQHRTKEGEFLYCDPVDLYLSHRKGWSIDDVQASSGVLEKLRQRGAKYFATAYPEIFTSRPQLKAALSRYRALEVTPKWAIYRLEP